MHIYTATVRKGGFANIFADADKFTANLINEVLLMKKHTNVFEQAEKHPKAKQFHGENLAHIRLAEAIYQERIAQNLTMKQLAEKANVTSATISRIEHAQNSTGIEVIFKLFNALGKEKIEIQCV